MGNLEFGPKQKPPESFLSELHRVVKKVEDGVVDTVGGLGYFLIVWAAEHGVIQKVQHVADIIKAPLSGRAHQDTPHE